MVAMMRSHEFLLDSGDLGSDSGGTLGVVKSGEGHPFTSVSSLGVLGVEDLVASLGLGSSGLGAGLLGVGTSGALSDGGMDGGVVLLEGLSSESLGPLGELLAESLGVSFLKLVVVGFNVLSEDVLSVLSGIERRLGLLDLGGLTTFVGDNLGLADVSSGESLGLVGDVETTVTGTLHGSENTVTGGGADETDIEESLEGSGTFSVGRDVVEITSDLVVSLVLVSETLVGKESSGGEETNTVGSGVVSSSSVESVGGELLGVSVDEADISLEGSVDDLADDSLVGSSDNESVLSGVVLILILEDQSTSGVVISLSLTSPAELSLVAHRVRLVLQNLNVTHIN